MNVLIRSADGLKIADLNRRKAIRERCLNCVGWEPKQVSSCQSSDCPMHAFRSGRGHQDASRRNQAIKDYCQWCMGDDPKQVADCSSKECPLYAYRLHRVDRSVQIPDEAIQDHRVPGHERGHSGRIRPHSVKQRVPSRKRIPVVGSLKQAILADGI